MGAGQGVCIRSLEQAPTQDQEARHRLSGNNEEQQATQESRRRCAGDKTRGETETGWSMTGKQLQILSFSPRSLSLSLLLASCSLSPLLRAAVQSISGSSRWPQLSIYLELAPGSSGGARREGMARDGGEAAG